MMHLRVLCPTERTQEVLDLLGDEAGATGVRVFRGAGVHPTGDVVEAEVAREAADGVLTDLERRGMDRCGVITLETLDLALGEEVERAERDAPGQGVDAVVWRELVARTEDDARLTATFLVLLVIATFIAAMGLLTDSQVLIVGAMVLGPEFAALAGLAVALVDRDRGQARLSATALLVGFPVAILATGILVAGLGALGSVPAAYLSGQRPLTSFVSSPDVYSVLVALLAGIAGTVSLTASKASTLVGVFISVTTVPAAAEIAAATVTGQGSRAVGALVQLLVNLGCIVVAAVVTLLVQRVLWRRIAGRAGQTSMDPQGTSAGL